MIPESRILKYVHEIHLSGYILHKSEKIKLYLLCFISEYLKKITLLYTYFLLEHIFSYTVGSNSLVTSLYFTLFLCHKEWIMFSANHSRVPCRTSLAKGNKLSVSIIHLLIYTYLKRALFFYIRIHFGKSSLFNSVLLLWIFKIVKALRTEKDKIPYN